MIDHDTQYRIFRAIEDNMHHAATVFVDNAQELFNELRRPSTIYRPTLTRDGDQFIALLGPDLQTGIVGIGDTPHKAMLDFDRAFYGTPPAAKGTT